jgi:AcrR family transcriptional regulator
MPSASTAARTRLTRSEAQALTRRRLLDAAARLLVEKSNAETSVEGIAEAAGYSIGAVYSNFGNKEELLLALLDEHMAASASELAHLFDGIAGEPASQHRALARYFEELATDHRKWWLLSYELWAYALRRPEARERLMQAQATCRDAVVRLISGMFHQRGLEPPIPPEQLARIVEALTDGLLRQRFLEQDEPGG